jgi:hypothetical protein
MWQGPAGRPYCTGPMNLLPATRMVPRFANPALIDYLLAMPKHIELPPRVAQAFVRDPTCSRLLHAALVDADQVMLPGMKQRIVTLSTPPRPRL